MDSGKIEYVSYGLTPYNGPDTSVEELEGQRYRYILDIPRRLDREQMEMIVWIVTQMKDPGECIYNGVIMRRPKREWTMDE